VKIFQKVLGGYFSKNTLYIERCDNLQSIADICILLGSYIDWTKISDKLACQGHRSRSRLFFGGFTV